MITVDLESILMCAEEALAALGPGPENAATAVALGDARRWQEARRAVRGAAGPGGEHPRGLGGEEV